MFCQRCGKEIKEGNKFCSKCGWQIQQMDDNAVELSKRNQQKKNRFGVILVVVLLMIAFVLGGLAIYRGWYIKNAEEQKEIDVLENQDSEEIVTANYGEPETNLEDRKPEDEEIIADSKIYILQSSEYYYANGNLLYKSEYIYDDAGKEIKEICYDEDDIVTQWYECKYENNKDGNEIKKRYRYIDSEMKGWEEYEYNIYGKLIKLRSCDEDGSVNEWIEFTYDDQGELIEGVETHSWGISNRYKCEYDSLGRCSKWMLYNENGGGMTHWVEYEYDENGNRIKETVYKADGSLDEWRENKYILLEMDNQYISREDNLEDMKEMSQYLSILLECDLSEYSYSNVDYTNLLWIAYCYMYENEFSKMEYSEYNFVISESDVNEFIEKYFGILIPCESFGDVEYKEGKFYFPGADYGDIGRTVAIIEDISEENNQYTITFYDVYIYSENFTTGKINPVDDWNEYYSYNINMIQEDEFCEINGKGTAILENVGDKVIVKELHINKNKVVENDNYSNMVNGERISLVGTLCYADDGRVVLKFKNDTIFYGEDGMKYEVDEVGIGAWEDIYYEFIDKSVMITGTLIEAHSQYHYRDIMILAESMCVMDNE